MQTDGMELTDLVELFMSGRVTPKHKDVIILQPRKGSDTEKKER